MKHGYLLTALCLGCFYQADAWAWGSVSDKIYSAALSGDSATINSYLSQGYSIDTPDGDGQTALCQAYHDKEWGAYNLLTRYGANTGAPCMAEEPHSYGKVLLIGAGVAAVGAGVAIAASGGGGGGSSSSSGSSDTKPSGGDSSGGEDTSEDDTKTNPEIANATTESVYDSTVNVSTRQSDLIDRMQSYLSTASYSHVSSPNFTYYTEDDFRKAGGVGYMEYSGYGVSDDHTEGGKKYKTVNFLDGIRAAKAYSYLYGYDSNKQLVNKLDSQHTVVAVLDTGVDVNHKEFQNADGTSKVYGKSFDYGPCRGIDRTSCWLIENYTEKSGVIFTETVTKQKRTLLDAHGKALLVDDDYEEGKLDEWAAMYPEMYDWTQLQDDPTPLVGQNPITKNEYTHGTHIAGIIAADWDRSYSGMMGVAFSNTDIYALRWDLLSPMEWPVKAALNENALVINMSLGVASTSLQNAKTIGTYKNNLKIGARAAAEATIDSYTTIKNNNTGYSVKDGTIWVMSAGNDSYSEPTILAGMKLLGKQYRIGNKTNKINYNDLMMLTVVSVDVTMNDDGTVKSYKKSSFSNMCGSTASYCIAAPGGNVSGYTVSDIYSTTMQTEGVHNEYGGLHGTSQATPVVSGSIALLKSAFPFLHSSEIIDLLFETANKSAADSYSAKTYGAGLLDLGKAVTYYIPPKVNNNTMYIATLSGDSVHSAYVPLDDAHLTVTSTMADAVKAALPQTITIFDRYYRPFETPTARYITATHAGYKAFKNDVGHIVPSTKVKQEKEGNLSFAYAEAPLGSSNGFGFMDTEYKTGKLSSGFFFSENTHYNMAANHNADAVNPFLSFNSAYGAHIGYDISPKYGFRLQAVAGRNGLYDGERDFNDANFNKSAYAIDSEVSFSPHKKWNLAFNSGMLYEDEALLGMNGAGAFGLPQSRTYYTGVKTSFTATPKWTFSGSYYQGFTEAQSFNSNMLQTGTLVSSSFALDANYKWDKATDFGFRISSPLRVEHGKLRVNMASGRDYYSDEVYRNQYTASMKPQKREYKFALYANKDMTEKLSLSGELDMRINPEHRAARNDYRALFGLAWNF